MEPNLEPEVIEAVRRRASLAKPCALESCEGEPDWCRVHDSRAYYAECEAKRLT